MAIAELSIGKRQYYRVRVANLKEAERTNREHSRLFARLSKKCNPSSHSGEDPSPSSHLLVVDYQFDDQCGSAVIHGRAPLTFSEGEDLQILILTVAHFTTIGIDFGDRIELKMIEACHRENLWALWNGESGAEISQKSHQNHFR